MKRRSRKVWVAGFRFFSLIEIIKKQQNVFKHAFFNLNMGKLLGSIILLLGLWLLLATAGWADGFLPLSLLILIGDNFWISGTVGVILSLTGLFLVRKQYR